MQNGFELNLGFFIFVNVVFVFNFQVLGFAVKKRAWDFELFAPQNLKIYFHKLEFVSKVGQLFTLDPVETLDPGRSVCTFIRCISPWYCKSTRAVLRGEQMFSCDFIVIFIFSKLLLWILILSTWGAIKNVYFFSFLFFFFVVYFSCYVIQKLL